MAPGAGRALRGCGPACACASEGPYPGSQRLGARRAAVGVLAYRRP